MSKNAANKSGESVEAPRKNPNFSPAVAGGYVFPVQERLERLREIQHQEQWAHQRGNITKAVQKYTIS